MTLKTALTGLLLLTVVHPAEADTRPKGELSFNFVNASSFRVTELRLLEKNNKWSRNWLPDGMAAGNNVTVELPPSLENRCEVPTRVAFSDGSAYADLIDYCGTDVVRVDNHWIDFE